MTGFDEAAYVREFVKPLRGCTFLPDDLIKRYAIFFPATEREVASTVIAVRRYWQNNADGSSSSSHVCKLCALADERLEKRYGQAMLTRVWWEERRGQQDVVDEQLVDKMAAQLKNKYGQLGVITRTGVHSFATAMRLAAADGERAAERAGLDLVTEVALPDSASVSHFQNLKDELALAGFTSVPALVHPIMVQFALLERYRAVDRSGRTLTEQLDARSVDSRIKEVGKGRKDDTRDYTDSVLRSLLAALREGADLRLIALYHLVDSVEEAVGVSMDLVKSKLVDTGLVEREAAILSVLLADRAAENDVASLARVRQLLADGKLVAAREVAATIAADQHRADAISAVDEATKNLEKLLDQASRERDAQHEENAENLLDKAGAISADDADKARATLRPAPPATLRASVDGARVRLSWQPAAGHGQRTRYQVVLRTDNRPAASHDDGTPIGEPSGELGRVHAHPPVARELLYAVFASIGDRPPSRPAVVAVTVLPAVSHLIAELGPNEVSLHWTPHPDTHEVRVRRGAADTPLQVTPVDGNSCHVGGLVEGRAIHFEVTAVYQSVDGRELRSLAAHYNATPRARPQPLPQLRALPVEVAGAVRLRVTWTPVDKSEVRVHRGDGPPPWSFGTWVTERDIATWGIELAGRQVRDGSEQAIEAEVPPGVHHLVPFSFGGTGIVVGCGTAVGITDPVRGLVVTPFADYATLSWEWPSTAELAEVRWEHGTGLNSTLVKLPQYRVDGGVRVPLGRDPCRVEVRAVVLAEGTRYVSPPVSEVINAVNGPELRYTVTGGWGGRTRKVTFVCGRGCRDVHVRVIAAPGRVLPISSADGVALLDTTLDLDPGVPTEHRIQVPRTIKGQYWVRCLVIDGQARLFDPPLSSLKGKK